VGKIAGVMSPRVACARFCPRVDARKRVGNGAPAFELPAQARSRLLPTLLPRPDQRTASPSSFSRTPETGEINAMISSIVSCTP
jgi:hypothetical protein